MAKTKALGNMTKHMTKAETEARAAAEAATLPTRPRVTLKRPPCISKDKLAAHYWNQTLKRMESGGIYILDDLDTEPLALYCSMLSRRDRLNGLCNQLVDASLNKEKTPAEMLAATNALDSLTTKLGVLERGILSYAEKLGLTPASRIGMARKKAQAETGNENDDLFGD